MIDNESKEGRIYDNKTMIERDRADEYDYWHSTDFQIIFNKKINFYLIFAVEMRIT